MSEALVRVTKGETQSITLAGSNRKAELVMKEVQLDERMIYKLGNGQVGILSNIWDWLGNERGLRFDDLTVLENTEDRVVVRLSCRYYNTSGQEVHDVEVYEIDCKRLHQISRMGWRPPEWVDKLDKDGRKIWNDQRKRYESRKLNELEMDQQIAKLQAEGYLKDEPIYDEFDMPIGYKRKLPPAAEKTLWDNFLTLKRHKLAKAQTCAHRRLVQRAIGTKTLDANSLMLQFPSISAAFTPQQIHTAVDDVYGSEDDGLVEELQGRRPITVDQEADVIEGEVVEQQPAQAAKSEPKAPEPPPAEPEPAPARPAAPNSGEHKASNVSWRHVVAAAENYHGKNYSGEQLMADMQKFNADARSAGMPLPCGVNEHGAPTLKACTPEQFAELVSIYQERIQSEAA